MRTFDAVLVVAHALQDYFTDGHNLSEYDQSESICLDKETPPWKDGQLLFEYMERVSNTINIEPILPNSILLRSNRTVALLLVNALAQKNQ